MLALTDHDETGGLAEAAQAACGHDIVLVPGVEISATWNNHTVHVVGLDIDAREPVLVEGLASIRSCRSERAIRVAAQLDAAGITGSLQGAARHAGNFAAIGRSHFARFLVEHKHVRNTNDAFQRYLGTGRVGYVAPVWPVLAQAVEWIRCAGGQSVLAHPDRYRLTPDALENLLGAFATSGGNAIEISGDSHSSRSRQVRLARRFGFDLSSGSDFHGPGINVPDVGEATKIHASEHALWQQLRTSR
jgi:3',5'-nucleoside bisphosphate phosphatase